MKEMNVEVFILNTNDEYLRSCANDLSDLCGFTGTNGLLIMTQDNKCPFFTDGRYITQAHNQLDHKHFQVYNTQERDPCEWVRENLSSTTTSGYYSRYFSIKDIKKYEQICKLVPCISTRKNVKSKKKIVVHPIKYSGESSQSKCKRIASTIDEDTLLTDVNSISWLLNIRDEYTEYTPHVICRAILYKNGNVDLFLENDELDLELDDHISIFNISELEIALRKLNSIVVDPSTTPMSIGNLVKDKHTIEKGDPCLVSKATKNHIEILGAINAHIRDGIAVTHFLHWLENNIDKKVTELDAEDKILEFRKESRLFQQNSFPTISASNENAAIIHYKATAETNKVITNGLYLIDSGGQYSDGTTDVTRTVAIGIPTREQIFHYTVVLKAHIAIASAIFPSDITGGELDILARSHLWKFSMDYMHGTGHGVGSYLSVHEGPQSISRGNKVKLIPGMIVSNEPGYYIPYQYGIRIENLMYVDKQEDGYLCFKQLTCVPYDKKLIDKKMLTVSEIKWIENYHQFVYRSHITLNSTQENGL